MTPEAFHRVALALPGATFDVKWGADRCYSVGGKMFAVAGPLDGNDACGGGRRRTACPEGDRARG